MEKIRYYIDNHTLSVVPVCLDNNGIDYWFNGKININSTYENKLDAELQLYHALLIHIKMVKDDVQTSINKGKPANNKELLNKFLNTLDN